jgi:hypothetical protein
MAKSLLETFGSLNEQVKDSLAEIDSPLLLSLAALDLAATEAGVDRLTAEHIVASLEAAGVAIRKNSVSRALARAGNRVSTSEAEDRETQYRLMTKGKKEVEQVFGGGLMSVVRIEGGRPRTARLTLGEMLSRLTGLVRICDPYYGVKTLDSLDHIPKSCRIRFLTARTNERQRTIQGAIRDFVRERPTAEVRLAPTPADLHDRYVCTSETLLLLGHGLKDIGGKESFVIRVERDLVPDLIQDIGNSFDGRWNKGTVL